MTTDDRNLFQELHGGRPLDGDDRLLAALVEARVRRDEALRRRRHLLAYAREFQGHWPALTLRALGAAADLSPSGVRTSYGREDVEAVAAALGVPVPARWRDDD
jgi:hypothetical protein